MQQSGYRMQHTEQHPALLRIDPATAFFYAPRSLSALAVGLSCLAYFGGITDLVLGKTIDSEHEWPVNTRRGVWAVILVYLAYSVVQGPRTSMIRPHPAVWRLVHGIVVVYTLLLVWMVFQEVEDARAFLKELSPSLGQPVQYQSYATDCRLLLPGGGWNTAVIKDTILDAFVVAHFLGWWAKALIFRNYFLLWSGSILFELMELTFRHYLPNFNECWWDSWVMDVLVCNFLGIVIGMKTVQYFQCKYEQYNWQGLSELQGFKAKARRTVQQLMPYSYDRFDWMAFSSPKRFLQSLFVVMLMLAFELNVFFLKYALWIPPTNYLNTMRLVVWFLCCLPAVREYFEYIDGRSPVGEVHQKLGPFAWLAINMACLETMLSYKFGRGLYPAPWPPGVVLAWSVVGVTMVVILAGWQLNIYLRRHHPKGSKLLDKKDL